MKIYLLLFALVVATIDADAQLPTQAEYTALMDLYTYTNGSNWTNKTGWSSANPSVVQSVSGWFGVVVDGQGHVTHLYLGGNNLSGEIPTSIGQLGSLTLLHIYSNQLHGSIPASLGSLQNLQELYLSTNQLSGPIPAGLGGLSSILTITFAGNNLTGPLPDELGNLTTLKNLYLDKNSITGSIPSTFGNMTSLEELHLALNNLSGEIPSSLGQLTNLKYLGLADNQLGGSIPGALGNLHNLRELSASTNQLSGPIPTGLGGLSSILTITFGGNRLTGPLPADLGNLTTLKNLYLNSNSITGSIPSTFGNMTSLEELHLALNNLSGEIPSSLGQLTNLKYLGLANNQLSGSIPGTLGNLHNLREVSASTNQLSGPIPTGLGGLSSILTITFGGNNLTGPLPADLGNLTTLKNLYLNSNSITGSIPSTFGNMAGLEELHLEANDLSGEIPSSLDQLSSLKYLGLWGNQLSGSIPAGIGNLQNLQDVSLANNKFTFSDLLPIHENFSGTFGYGGQDLVDIEKDIDAEPNAPATLTTNIDRSTTPSSLYQWFKVLNGVTTPLNSASTSGHTFVLSTTGEQELIAKYYYQITNPNLSGMVLTSRIQRIARSFPIVDMNYVRTINTTKSGITDVTDAENGSIEDRIINFTYLDGLGRSVQQVIQQGSPEGRDIVQPVRYDDFGRETKKYLPFVSGSNGAYKSNNMIIDGQGNYVDVAKAFYSGLDGDVAIDNRPFSETVFEASPLNRPEKDYGPGLAWAAVGGADRPIKHQYLTNVHSLTGNATDEKIIAWEIPINGVLSTAAPESGFIEEGGYYSSFQLSIKGTLDEQGNAVREYTNKEGQVILKKVQAVTSPTNLNDPEQWASTYYIYDDLGNLTVVLPPEGVKQFLSLEN